MQRTARACWIESAGHAQLRTHALPSPREHEVLVEASYSAVSRGTEALIYAHAVPESERERMRAPFQEGTLPGPVKYGYASVGRVVEGPAPLLGRSVFCLYPHQSAYVVDAHHVVPLPEGLPEARAVLAANMETALNALWDARPLLGSRIVVVGAGVVGLLVAHLAARIPGCEVVLVDLLPERAVAAAAVGCKLVSPEQAPVGWADLVLHASGSQAGLHSALSIVRDEGTVIELSWFGDRMVALPLGAAFHAGRLTLRSSQVGRVATAMRGRYDPPARLALALQLLREPALDALITSESELDALPQVLQELASGSRHTLCHRIRYGGS